MILFSILNILLLIILFKVERKATRGDVFSAGSFFIYFAFLPALSNLYFAFNQESFQNIVLSMLANQYRDMFYVQVALIMQILANVITYAGIYVAYSSNDKFSSLIFRRIFLYNLLENRKNIEYQDKLIFIFGLVVFLLGLLVYLKFLSMIGGLVSLWSNLQLRSTLNAGLGYFQTFYMIAVQFGSFFMIYIFYKRKKYFFAFLVIIVVIAILGSLGSRGPTIHFLITVLIFYHYKIKRVRSIFNYKLLLMYISFPIFIVVMLQFRSNSSSELTDINTVVSKSIKSLERGFIARVGHLERDVVILKYFSEHDFWWGQTYYSLITAPIPRTMYPDKPPNDTGMYLRTIAAGIVVNPPQSVPSLLNSSWPELNWVGYMNWGIIGFMIIFFLSGYLTGKMYIYVLRYNIPLLGTFLYSYLIIGGQLVLSPLPLINYMMLALILNVLSVFIFYPIKTMLSSDNKRRSA